MSHPSYWAFSGQVKTTFYDADSQAHATDLPYTAHCVFEHEIDSRGVGIVDEGDMFTLPNGDSIEMGIMLNPTTGSKELYKEYWTAFPLSSKSTTVAVTKDHNGIAIRIDDQVQCVLFDSLDSQLVQAGRFVVRNSPEAKISVSADGRNNIKNLPLEWLTEKERRVGDSIADWPGNSNPDRGPEWQIIERYDG